jgi:Flp pilus assembly pilin Flp
MNRMNQWLESFYQALLHRIHRTNERDASSQERGYALLEYCAGAAVVAIVLWAAMQTLGASVSTLLGNISDWALARAAEVGSGAPQ